MSFYLARVTLGETLKTTTYILNRVPTKVAAKTPYELWVGQKPSLKHFHVWECQDEARPYRPNEKKLDSQIVSSYFIGYSERSRGYKFYNPKSNSLFETRTTTFFEDIEFLGKNKVKDFVLEEETVRIPLLIHIIAFNQANMEPPQDIFEFPLLKMIW